MIKAHLGIDVSKDKLDLGWLRDPKTLKKKTKVFPNKLNQFTALASWILKNTKAEPDQVFITIEPSNVYHEAIIHFLHEQGFKVFLANTGLTKKFMESIGAIHKTDKADSISLARYGHSLPEPRLWQPEPVEVRELKALMRRLDALEKDLQREQNRQETSEISGSSSRVLESLESMIKALEEEIKDLQSDIDDHIDKHPNLKKNRELLKSIRGIGNVMSRELVYLFAAKRFKNAKQVAAFLGLIPKIKESGKLKGKSMLSKNGPSRIRAKLYMAAITAGNYNPDIKAQKERLLADGKLPMQALGAAMRKLVQICFGVIKHQKEYQAQTGLIPA